MRSHTYQFSVQHALRVLAAPLLGLALWSLFLHTLAGAGLLPAPTPIANTDETFAICKSRLSRSRQSAEIVLVGDSSCATGVDALELSARLPEHPPVLNLGLVIGMGLDIYGEALADFVAANPGKVRLVVLLVTPELLTNETLAPVSQAYWRSLRVAAKEDDFSGEDFVSRVTGAALFRRHLLPRVLHQPLKGPGGAFYGFSSDLARFLLTHRGTLVDPGRFDPPRRPKLSPLYLAPSLEAQTRRFRRHIPAGVRLALGLTPLPRSLAPLNYSQQRDSLLRAWDRWAAADTLLTNAPAVLPDVFFAGGAHLNEQGQRIFSRELAPLLHRAMAQAAVSRDEVLEDPGVARLRTATDRGGPIRSGAGSVPDRR